MWESLSQGHLHLGEGLVQLGRGHVALILLGVVQLVCTAVLLWRQSVTHRRDMQWLIDREQSTVTYKEVK